MSRKSRGRRKASGDGVTLPVLQVSLSEAASASGLVHHHQACYLYTVGQGLLCMS